MRQWRGGAGSCRLNRQAASGPHPMAACVLPGVELPAPPPTSPHLVFTSSHLPAPHLPAGCRRTRPFEFWRPWATRAWVGGSRGGGPGIDHWLERTQRHMADVELGGDSRSCGECIITISSKKYHPDVVPCPCAMVPMDTAYRGETERLRGGESGLGVSRVSGEREGLDRGLSDLTLD